MNHQASASLPYLPATRMAMLPQLGPVVQQKSEEPIPEMNDGHNLS